MNTISHSIIPDDIKRDILLRLPVKSLVRFRRVCELWHSIITDPEFIHSHLDHSCKTRLPSIVFALKCLPSNVCPPKFYGKQLIRITRLDADKHLGSSVTEPYFLCTDIYVCNSCNGLICIIRCSDKNVRVWNPSTGECLIPPEQTKSCHPTIGMMSTVVYLGFHPVTKEYKLINLIFNFKVQKGNHPWVECEVYTLGTSSWREIGKFPGLPYGEVLVSPKGSMYWNTSMGKISFVRFDLEREVFEEKPPFDLVHFYKDQSHYDIGSNIMNLHGSIGIPVFLHSKTDEIPQMDLWVLNDDEHSWTRKYSVIYPWRYDYLRTPLFVSKDRILLHVGRLRRWSKRPKGFCRLHYHHLTRGEDEQGEDSGTSFEEVKIFGSCDFDPVLHIESLVPLTSVPAQTSAT